MDESGPLDQADPGEPAVPHADFPAPPASSAPLFQPSPPAPTWLKAAVAGAAVFAVVVVSLAVHSIRATQPSGRTSPLPIGVVAREFCATKLQVVQAISAAQVAAQSGDPTRTLQQNKLSLAQIQDAITQLRNESEQAKASGDSALADGLAGMADSLQEVHDGIVAVDAGSIQDGASKLIPFAENVKGDPAIASTCP